MEPPNLRLPRKSPMDFGTRIVYREESWTLKR